LLASDPCLGLEGAFAKACCAFIANMRRASAFAICKPSKIAALNLSSDGVDEVASGGAGVPAPGLAGGPVLAAGVASFSAYCSAITRSLTSARAERSRLRISSALAGDMSGRDTECSKLFVWAHGRGMEPGS
jgi:hypothetical protein